MGAKDMKGKKEGREGGGKLGCGEISLCVKAENGKGGGENSEGLLIGSKLFQKGNRTISGIGEWEKVDEVARRMGCFRDLYV
jgi:hypothetical protein